MRYSLVYMFVAMTLMVGWSSADTCTQQGKPRCTVPEELNRPFRNFWDPTKYWRCPGLNTNAISVRCPDSTGFSDKYLRCIPFIDWSWTQPIMPPSCANVITAPQVPQIPQVPQVSVVPQWPKVPVVEQIPVVPQWPNVPVVEQIPVVPQWPKVPVVEQIPVVPQWEQVPVVEQIPVVPQWNQVPVVPKVTIDQWPQSPALPQQFPPASYHASDF